MSKNKRYNNTGKYNPTKSDSWTSTSKYAAKKTVFVSSITDLENCVGHLVGIKFKCTKCGCIEYMPRFRKENIQSISQFLCKRCKHSLISKSHPEWQEKGFKAYEIKTGYDNPFKNPKSKLKGEKTYAENHNGYSMKNDPNLIKRLKQYHIDHPEWFHNKKLFFYGLGFDSMWELAFWIYARDHNEFIIREPFMIPYIDNSGRYTIPDFWYKDRLIEIKGNHLSSVKTDGSIELKNSYNLADKTGEAKLMTLNAYECEIYRKQQMGIFLSYVYRTYGIDYLKRFYKSDINNPSYSTPNGNVISNNSYYTKPVFVGKGVSPYDAVYDKDGYTVTSKTNISPYDLYNSKPTILSAKHL